jgi:hypothetical protein
LEVGQFMKLISNRLSNKVDQKKIEREGGEKALAVQTQDRTELSRPVPEQGVKGESDPLVDSPRKDKELSERKDQGDTSKTGQINLGGGLKDDKSFAERAANEPASTGDGEPPSDSVTPNIIEGEGADPELPSTEHHRVTWEMLRVLSVRGREGKFKAADGSDLWVVYLGEEAPLGDVFQIEHLSPDLGQTASSVIVLSNPDTDKIEVLGAQEIVTFDTAPFEFERQPNVLSQEVAEALFAVYELELSEAGAMLLESVREAYSRRGDNGDVPSQNGVVVTDSADVSSESLIQEDQVDRSESNSEKNLDD